MASGPSSVSSNDSFKSCNSNPTGPIKGSSSISQPKTPEAQALDTTAQKTDAVVQEALLGAQVEVKEVSLAEAKADELIDRYQFNFSDGSTSTLDIRGPNGKREQMPTATMKNLSKQIPELFEQVKNIELLKIKTS